jgi:SPP1 family predicted phage head-tail adaptor
MLKGIDIGSLDRRISLRSFSVTKDAETNANVRTYTTVATVWAKRLGKKSIEDFEAKQPTAITTQRYLIRHKSGVAEKMQLVDANEIFEIKGIEEGPSRRSYLILTVEKRDGE